MNTTHFRSGRHSSQALCALAAMFFCGTLRADTNAPVNLRISVSGAGELSATELQWHSVPGALYQVQTRDTFDAVTPWKTIDIAQPPGTNGLFRLSPRLPEISPFLNSLCCIPR